MRLSIGFNRHLEMDWLVQTASWAANGFDGQDLKNKIDLLLTPRFDSQVAKDKTRNLLFGVWCAESKYYPVAFHDDACRYLLHYSELNAALHWGMMLVKYPFFYNVVSQVGKMARHDGEFIYNQLEQRIVEVYGDTSTIKRCMQFVVRTMINLEMLSNPALGLYKLKRPVQIQQPELCSWLAEVSIRASGNTSKSLDAIVVDPAWFPFDIQFNEYCISLNPRLELHHQANGSVVFL